MVQTPNSTDLKSEEQCLRKKISLANNTLQHAQKMIKEITKTPTWMRGSEENVKLVEYQIMEKRLIMAIDMMQFDEKNTDHFHIDVPEPLEIIASPNPSGQPDKEYLL